MAATVPPQFAQYYNLISAAAADRLTTQDLWELISDYEAQEGISRPQGLFAAVTTMRSIAVSVRNSGEKLAAAPDSAVIDATMLSQGINSRPLVEQQLAPAYTVRYQATVLTSEGESTVWRSIIRRGALPLTKGDLVDLVFEQFLDGNASYGEIATGLTGSINITAW